MNSRHHPNRHFREIEGAVQPIFELAASGGTTIQARPGATAKSLKTEAQLNQAVTVVARKAESDNSGPSATQKHAGSVE
jgi:hypothetical protein